MLCLDAAVVVVVEVVNELLLEVLHRMESLQIERNRSINPRRDDSDEMCDTYP